MVKSIYESQEELLLDLMSLHCPDGFECDLTYSKGVFYKNNVPQPRLKFDLVPLFSDVVSSDSRNVPIESGTINSIMFDPPFLAGWSTENGTKGIIKERFSCYRTIDELWSMYFNTMVECKRLLVNNGIMVFKCQDTVQDHKNYFSHVEIMNYAYSLDLYPKDLFILLAKHRLPRNGQIKQEHARKFHSYFWVLENRPSRVFYKKGK